MDGKRILIVDDEPAICKVLADLFDRPGIETVAARDGKSALRLAEEPFDVALLDLSLPGASGLDILKKIKQHHPQTPVVIMTAYATVQTAVKAVSYGAYDFITKPFDLDELQALVERALDRTSLLDEHRYLRSEMKSRYQFDNVIGQNREVQEAYLLAARVADSKASVLILGETGTGKEYLARAIHYHSPRAEKPFIKVNCAALPESLLESELFGHEKGAFTHAVARRIGRFELADGGTMFLDEIGDLSPAMQVKLLRVLQEREFERVGGSETLRVNVRIVAATNRDLDAAIREERFREDLFYRLNVITLRLPPLRERMNDLPNLVAHFIEKYRRETSKPVTAIDPAAMARIQRQAWRGNIRELENCIERAVILAKGERIELPDLLLDDAKAAGIARREPGIEGPTAGLPLREIERRHILATLEAGAWNQTRVSATLGIDRKTLRSKIREYELAPSGSDHDEFD